MKQDGARKRDASIEMYRVVLMLLICLLHSFTLGIAPNKYWGSALMWAVCGFVFISGWFGIRFSFSRGLRLFCLGLICGGVAIAIGKLLDVRLSSTNIAYILARQWFLCAYLMLMLFAPFLNMAFEQVKLSRSNWYGAIFPLTVIIIWNWLGNLNPWLEYGPYTPGLGSYTFLMMLTVYSLGRVSRIKCDSGSSGAKVPTWKIGVAAFANLVILVCGWRLKLGEYCSPFAMSMSILAFFLFKRVVVPRRLETVILFIAPSMFSIYLLHAHTVGAVCIKRMQNLCLESGMSHYLFIPLSAIVVFSSCLALDLVRRAVASPLSKSFQRLYKFVDCRIEGALGAVGRAI